MIGGGEVPQGTGGSQKVSEAPGSTGFSPEGRSHRAARRAGSNAIIYVGSAVLNAAIPFLLLPILSRALGTEGYGIVGTFAAMVQGSAVLIGLSTHGYLTVAYFEKSTDDFAAAVAACLSLGLATAPVLLVVLILADPLVVEVSGIGADMYWSVVLAALGQFLVQVCLAVYQVRGQAIVFGTTQVAGTAANLGLTLVLVLQLGMGWEGRAVGQAVALGATGLVGVLVLRGSGALAVPTLRVTREALRFGVPLVPHALAVVILLSVDRFVITGVLDSATAGTYFAAFQVSSVLTLVASAANQAWAPWLIDSLQDPTDDDLRRIRQITLLSLVALAVGALVLILSGGQALRILAGSEYSDGSRIMPLLVCAAAARGAYYLFTNFIFFAKRTELLSLSTAAVAGLQVVGMMWAVPRFGILGAATTVLGATLLHLGLVAVVANLLVPSVWRGGSEG